MTSNVDIYGEVRLDSAGNPPPSRHVDTILGFRVGRVAGKAAGLDIHFESQGEVLSMTVPLIQAMWLLSILKSFQLNEGLPFPDDPRDASWRAGDHM